MVKIESGVSCEGCIFNGDLFCTKPENIEPCCGEFKDYNIFKEKTCN